MFIKCQCAGCNNVGTHKLALAKRGGRSAYVCDFHYEYNESYGNGGDNNKGTRKANGKRCGIELETSFTSENARIELLGAGFTPTNDCSLDGDFTTEYVSPLYSGMNAITRYVKSIEKMLNNGDIEINDTCGTHFHFSIDNMRTESGVNICEVLQDSVYFSRVFAPISNAMKDDSYKTRRVFGRYFTHYCKPIESNSYAGDRYFWINTTNYNNIEFRLFKFTSAKQYVTAMQFAQDVVVSLMNNFNTWYQMTEAEKLHNCDVVAQKIVRKFEKIDI